jgi:hypothetical protein
MGVVASFMIAIRGKNLESHRGFFPRTAIMVGALGRLRSRPGYVIMGRYDVAADKSDINQR